MIVVSTLDKNDVLTSEQREELCAAEKREIVYDDDSPALTPEMEAAFRIAASNRNNH